MGGGGGGWSNWIQKVVVYISNINLKIENFDTFFIH